jgi:hypothetical protein
MINKLLKILGLAALAGASAYAQLTTPSTTLSTAIAASTTAQWCVASATGVVVPSLSGSTAGSFLNVDREFAQVVSAGSSTTCFNVKRGQLGSSANYSHASGARVWVGAPAIGSGDNSRPFNGAFVGPPPSGNCTASAQFTLPVITSTPLATGVPAGSVFTCAGGRWGRLMEWWVPPSNCSFAPTTLTTTNILTQIGASNVMVMQGTSNAAAGTNTLTCNINVPTSVVSQRGAALVDITTFVGSQTTAPTSLGTSTLGTISFPAAATSETPSTVTPVAAGSTVTTVSPTQITTVTTAGSFLTIKHTYLNSVVLDTDNQLLQYTMPFVQSAAAAMVINTPGLIVHYLVSE